MKQKTNKLSQSKQWILSIVIGRFRYKYEYYSPFGESWLVYRVCFGFIPIKYIDFKYQIIDSRENQAEAEEYVNGLNAL